jgi:formate dehydrogenase iron-sulfur subunit
MAQTAQGPQSGLAVRRISATPGHSLERGPDGAPAARTGPEYAKLIDISRCIGCKGCEVACKEWNELGVEPTENFGSMQSHRDLSPDTWLLMRFNEIEVADDLQWLIKKDACLHCEEPGCLYACPAPGAIVQYENGIVDFNQEQCIGCQLCVSGCPFDIPRFNPDTKKVYKCNMCIDRVEAGLEPACVKTCPTNAISWGTKEDMVALGAKKVEGLQGRGLENATLYDPAGVGGTHMMYVVPHGDQLDEYDLPADPTAAPGALAALGGLRQLGASALGLGLLATALHYLGFGPQEPEPEGVPSGTGAGTVGGGTGGASGGAGGGSEASDGVGDASGRAEDADGAAGV